MQQNKKAYSKPSLTVHGSVEAITGFSPDQGHDVFGNGFLSFNAKCNQKGQSPAHNMS